MCIYCEGNLTEFATSISPSKPRQNGFQSVRTAGVYDLTVGTLQRLATALRRVVNGSAGMITGGIHG